jgi:excisionase family DNA binding protein
MNPTKLTVWQIVTLAATSLPMAAIGVAGGVASFFNFQGILNGSQSAALSVVLAGEGAVLTCALIALSLTLMGQHSPTVVRLGMWLLPLVGSVAGVLLAPTFNTQVIMGVAPMAMTVAGEGITLVARRTVRHNTGVDLEAQRRAGLLVWHAGRAANGNAVTKRLSKAAVWRLTKSFAQTDGQMSIQVDDVQRFRISENLDGNLLAALTGAPDVAPSTPTLPPARPSESLAVEPAPILNPEVLPALTQPSEASEVAPAGDGYDFIREVLAEAETTVKTAPAPSDLMTVAEVASELGIAAGTVRSWVHRGKLAKVGTDADGRTLVSRLDVSKL